MKTIIQQKTQQLMNNLMILVSEAANSQTLDLDELATGIHEECTKTSKETLEAIVEGWNRDIRKAKEERKKNGLVLKEKDRPRELLTHLGLLQWKRDYYYSKREDCYVTPLDQILGIKRYERMGNGVSAALVNCTAFMSYAQSSKMVTGEKVSRQTGRNSIKKVKVPEKEVGGAKKEKGELHIFADEDHVHMQRPHKERGKRNQIVPVITVCEGIEPVSKRRNRTICPMHLVDENFDPKQLWKSTEGYIEATYDTSKIEKIYIHGDGGQWIKSGLAGFPQAEHVMDGYHFSKRLRRFAKDFPDRRVK